MSVSNTKARADRARQLILTMSVIVIVTVLLLLTLFVHSTIQGLQTRLLEEMYAVKSLIEAVGRFDQQHSEQDIAGGSVAATLSQVLEAYERHAQAAGHTEFVLAER
ncbi:MAG: hypothetical protein H6974_07745 [Gammaproteobacteria bacterium]|nr:hypothetical protein [Gammaproteobacteria bacterium]